MTPMPTGRHYLSTASMPTAPEPFVRHGDPRPDRAATWIVDPGLAHHRGHHHSLDVLLRDACERLGDRAEVLCHRSFPAEPGFVPTFRLSIYEARAASPVELDTRLAAHAEAFGADLRQALDGRITKDDLLLFPTAHLSLLAPLCRWLDSLPAARRPALVRLHFHVSPTYGMDGDTTRARASTHFVEALQALVREHGACCTADHPQLAAELTALCGVAVEALKSPHVVPPGVQRVKRHDGRIRLLFIGEPRAEKGYVTVIQALPGILGRTRRCDVRFVLPVMREADLAYLRTLPPDRVSVRLEDGLPSQAYFAEIAQADHVLCVYDPARYAATSSGIAVDAALLDVPMIITRGTATERAVVDPSRVHVLAEPTAPALVALCEALDREFDAGMTSAASADAEAVCRADLERDDRCAPAVPVNVVWHEASVTRDRREQLNGHRAVVVWFTGLSGAGKSTIAHAVEEALHRAGRRTFVFDGDNVRHGLCADLGFSPEHRRENLRRVGEMSRLFIEAGVIALTAFISPYRDDRARVREIVGAGNLLEVYVKCPLDVCESRDVKGMYRRARAGEIREFTGISSPYEAPDNPDLVVDTSELSLGECVDRVLRLIAPSIALEAAGG